MADNWTGIKAVVAAVGRIDLAEEEGSHLAPNKTGGINTSWRVSLQSVLSWRCYPHPGSASSETRSGEREKSQNTG